jgi:hypothetical protein
MDESIITLSREELLRIIEEATKHAVEFEVCEGEQVLDKRARSWFVTMSGYLTRYVGRPVMDDVYERMGFNHLTSKSIGITFDELANKPKEEQPPC